MFKEFWQKNKDRIIHEVGFWLTLAVGFVASDGADVLISLYHGDFSDGVLLAFRTLLITSLVKAVMVVIFPALFPLYQKDKGILPATTEDDKPEADGQ